MFAGKTIEQKDQSFMFAVMLNLFHFLIVLTNILNLRLCIVDKQKTKTNEKHLYVLNEQRTTL